MGETVVTEGQLRLVPGSHVSLRDAAGRGEARPRRCNRERREISELVAYFDLRPVFAGSLFGARRHVAGQFQERLAFARRSTMGLPRIAADADLRIERQFGQEMHLHLARRSCGRRRG